jgi:hypothetical protein
MAARRPWWYLTKTARQSFLLGVFWCLLGLVMLLGGSGHAWSLVVGIAWLVCAGGYLASAVERYWREHSRAALHASSPNDLPPSC